MKKLMRLGVLCGVLTLLLCVGALAADSPPDGQYTYFTVKAGTYVAVSGTNNTTFSATVTGVGADNQCLLLVLTDTETPTVSNIIYVDQATADGSGKATFSVIPTDMNKNETYYIYATSASAAMSQTPATFMYYYSAAMRGDVSGDKNIRTNDAILVLQHVAKKLSLQDAAAISADCSGDGNIRTNDAILILQHVAKIIDLTSN